MKRLLLFAVLALMSHPLWAADAPVAVTNTVKVAGLEVAKDQILITPKPGYIHILWDAYPDRPVIQAAGKKFSLETAAQDLVKGPGLTANPAAKTFRVDIVEFSERDSYGAPRWETIQFLGRFELILKGKQWSVKPRAN